MNSSEDEVSKSLNKMQETFSSFNRQVVSRSKSIQILKEKIRVEQKETQLKKMQEAFLKMKLDAVKNLVSLLGAEMEKVEKVQRKIIDQQKLLIKTSEKLKEMELIHTQEMASRKVTIEKFKQTYDQRLKMAVRKMWLDEQEKVKELEKKKRDLEEKLKNLKMETRQREFDHKRKEEAMEMEFSRKQQKIEMEGKIEIEKRRHAKLALEKKFDREMMNLQVQTEGKIKQLKGELDKRKNDLAQFPAPPTSRPSSRKLTPGKGKRKSEEHPYLPDYEEDKGSK